MYYQSYKSPIGYLHITASDKGLLSLIINDNKPVNARPNEVTKLATVELVSYFNGKLDLFTVPLDWSEASPFFKSVWEALLKIPYGDTLSYQAIANTIGNPNSSRAVGMANAKNPIAIIVPCHRVIGTNGSLTGYAYGKEKKSWLLRHEGVMSLSNKATLF